MNELANQLCEFDLQFRRCAETGRALRLCAYCRNDARMGMTEDVRSPRPDKIDEFVPIGVGNDGAFAAGKNNGDPPTPRNARTGEFTPPGMTTPAR